MHNWHRCGYDVVANVQVNSTRHSASLEMDDSVSRRPTVLVQGQSHEGMGFIAASNLLPLV